MAELSLGRCAERQPRVYGASISVPTGGQVSSDERHQAGRHGWPERFADRVQQALARDEFVARDYLVRAKADTIRLTAGQLRAVGAQRRAWERRMGELLLGASRVGRHRQPRGDRPGPVFPGGEIYLSFPGLGDRLAARVAGEIG